MVSQSYPAFLFLVPFAGIPLTCGLPQCIIDQRRPGSYEIFQLRADGLPRPDAREVNPPARPVAQAGHEVRDDLRSIGRKLHGPHCPLHGTIENADCHQPLEPFGVEGRRRLILQPLHEMLEVLLAAEAHPMRQLQPGGQIAGDFQLAEAPLLRRLQLERLLLPIYERRPSVRPRDTSPWRARRTSGPCRRQATCCSRASRSPGGMDRSPRSRRTEPCSDGSRLGRPRPPSRRDRRRRP